MLAIVSLSSAVQCGDFSVPRPLSVQQSLHRCPATAHLSLVRAVVDVVGHPFIQADL